MVDTAATEAATVEASMASWEAAEVAAMAATTQEEDAAVVPTQLQEVAVATENLCYKIKILSKFYQML